MNERKDTPAVQLVAVSTTLVELDALTKGTCFFDTKWEYRKKASPPASKDLYKIAIINLTNSCHSEFEGITYCAAPNGIRSLTPKS